MIHKTSRRFWTHFRALPLSVRDSAVEAHAHMVADEQHPGVRLKAVGRFWSARIGLRYRALGVKDGDTIVWFWIGHHRVYDRLVAGQ